MTRNVQGLCATAALALLAASHTAIAADQPSPSTNQICAGNAGLDTRGVFLQLDVPPDNQVLAFLRNADGSLCAQGVYGTGGHAGAFGVLVSGQNSVIAQDGYLLVVNGGSPDGFGGEGSVSVLRVEPDQLVLTDSRTSHGPEPRSVTRHGDLVYVVNSGSGPGFPGLNLHASVQGYRLDSATGRLTEIDDSFRNMIDPFGDPAQIEFTPDGHSLVVSQRHPDPDHPDSRYLEVFSVHADGTPGEPTRYDVGGDNPFGFRFLPDGTLLLTHGQLVDGVASGASSHRIDADSRLTTITPFTVDGAEETCWNYVSRSTRRPYMYTSAYFDSAVGRWSVADDGRITLNDAFASSSAMSGDTRYLIDAGGLDMTGAVDASGQEYLYVLNAPVPQPLTLPVTRLQGYAISAQDGTLTRLNNAVVTGIASTAHGLWAQ